MTKMKTAWFFGDSFIYGAGCRDKTTEKNRLMSQIVSEELNCIEKNLGGYGYSNQTIITSIINNLPKMKKNDYVIIFDTFSARSHFVDETKDFYIDWSENTYFKVKPDKLKAHYSMALKHTENFLHYYQKIYNNLVEHLNSIGIISKYFPSQNTQWQNEKKIRKIEYAPDDTGGHWSFKGHKTVSEWVLNSINNKDNRTII
jgi:hypothetical protein